MYTFIYVYGKDVYVSMYTFIYVYGKDVYVYLYLCIWKGCLCIPLSMCMEMIPAQYIQLAFDVIKIQAECQLIFQ